jgi:hypothetical protein
VVASLRRVKATMLAPTGQEPHAMTAQPDSRPDDHLRCRSGRHVWLDYTARDRCCDPTWRKVLVQQHEWGTPAAAGIEYAGRSAVAGLDYGWQRTADLVS